VSVERLRRDALDAWRAGVGAASPARNVEQALGARTDIRHHLQDTFVLATGKAAAAMVRGVGPGARGMAIVPRGSNLDGQPAGTRSCFADHPVPSAEGISVSRDALARVEALGESARLLYLVSGGSSAMFEVPRDSISEKELIDTYARLLTSGLPIDRINVVRRALSAVKGGRLASAAYPATVTTLAVSDVEGDVPEAIGSGPTVRAEDPPGLAFEIVRECGLEASLPVAVVGELQRPSLGPAGPARIDGYEIVASLGHAEDGAVEKLESAGYRCIAPPVSRLTGETTEAAWSIVEAATAATRSGRKAAIVVGGETTLKVPASAGSGGRNGHFAAVLAAALYKKDGFACMVGGTDGIDGNCSAAGALIDGESARRAAVAGHDLREALERFDTGAAFAASGDAIVTGPTGTNVGDLLVAVFDGG
jgi:glycerate-2-kinase